MKKLKEFTKEELELMSYDDIAYLILKEKKKKLKTAEIFGTIKEMLEMPDAEYEARIGDFFTLLATEKRFIQLEQGYWDLRENHTPKIEIEEDEEDEEGLEEENITESEIEDEDDIYLDDNPDEDDADDDLKDLVMLDDPEDEL